MFYALTIRWVRLIALQPMRKLKNFVVKFSGAVEVEAEDEDGAINNAWVRHGVRQEDIESIEEQ